MTKHTPGPWRNGDSRLHIAVGNVLAGRNRLVANCLGFASNETGDTVAENLANAALIAQAPALLAAAKAIVTAVDNHHPKFAAGPYTLTAGEIAALRAAISAAEGVE